MIIANLLRGGDGLPIGAALAGVQGRVVRRVAYLAYYDWIGISKSGDRVWVLSDAKARPQRLAPFRYNRIRHAAHRLDPRPIRRPAFRDYLLAAGMKNHVEEGSNGWAVWVEDDDKLDAAKTELAAFLANPADGRYDAAVEQAEKIRVDEEKKQDRRRKQFRDMRTSWGGSRSGRSRSRWCCFASR
jgi:hypothetical protein